MALYPGYCENAAREYQEYCSSCGESTMHIECGDCGHSGCVVCDHTRLHKNDELRVVVGYRCGGCDVMMAGCPLESEMENRM